MLRVLTLSTLFPDATRPNFGVFVERQTLELASRPDTDLRVVAPVGLPFLPFPPFPPLGRHGRLAALPGREVWKGLDVHRPRFLALPATRGRWHARRLTSALEPALAALREEFPFDVIDASFFFPDGPAAVEMGRRFGVPVSIKARGSDVHYWGSVQPTAAQVLAAGHAAGGLLAVSEAMKRDMVALGLPGERVRVHRTGVDLGRFAPRDRSVAKAGLGVGGPLVVSAGALIESKGHQLVVEAMLALPGMSLLIAGEGPRRSALQGRIAALGLGRRVRLLGTVPHAEMPALLAAADVMALASAREGLANVWIESLASGTPLVVPDVGGIREVIDRPAYGRIVEPTPSAIAAGIASICAAPPVADEVRVGALAYTWDNNAAALHEHLSALVDGASRG